MKTEDKKEKKTTKAPKSNGKKLKIGYIHLSGVQET